MKGRDEDYNTPLNIHRDIYMDNSLSNTSYYKFLNESRLSYVIDFVLNNVRKVTTRVYNEETCDNDGFASETPF